MASSSSSASSRSKARTGDPNLKSWSVHVIGGKKLAHLGDVHAADEASAIKAASEKFTTLTIAPDKAAGGQSDRH
jgi:hypothetical protein